MHQNAALCGNGKMDRKHFRNRRKCWLPAILLFPQVFKRLISNSCSKTASLGKRLMMCFLLQKSQPQLVCQLQPRQYPLLTPKYQVCIDRTQRLIIHVQVNG